MFIISMKVVDVEGNNNQTRVVCLENDLNLSGKLTENVEVGIKCLLRHTAL